MQTLVQCAPKGAPQATKVAQHAKGSKARVLLTSVFGPYARDDEYGSRIRNPMELYHNQVTREQGPFSLRMFHRSWGLMFIQANIDAPCTLLDFPTLERFVEEISTKHYDIVGISSILVNFEKVRLMCELIRKHLPNAKIVVGGHIANMPGLDQRIKEADFIVKGEGIRWFREYLGENPDQPIRHPLIMSGIGTRSMGFSARERPGDVAATLVPGVGCPIGCNFCSTSWMFGGKGKSITFYKTGDELFHVMCGLEKAMRVQSFFVMDENFLYERKRALRLLELMEKHDKAWSLYIFSSARVIQSYTMDELVRLGVSWVWMGLEGENSQYDKLKGVDMKALIREMQSHGIRVLASAIIGLEEHTRENIKEAIRYAVGCGAVCLQFMLYTPLHGTPLHQEIVKRGLLIPEEEYPLADRHGQHQFSHRHPNFSNGEEAELIRRAFETDLKENGPSILRIARTTLEGWKRYGTHENERIRRRFQNEARGLATRFAAITWACREYKEYREMAEPVLRDLYTHFGLKARISAMIGGRVLLRAALKEERRLRAGWTYEPPTFYERNFVHEGTPPCESVLP